MAKGAHSLYFDMPFFDASGKQLEDESAASRHVYAPNHTLLKLAQLRALMHEEGYYLEAFDPESLKLLPELPHVGACLLISQSKTVLEALPARRTRTKLLRLKNVLLVDLVVESPFDVEVVLGPSGELDQVLGKAVAQCLKNAKTLYAVNIPSQAFTLSHQVLGVLTKVIAQDVSGVIYDCDKGRVIS